MHIMLHVYLQMLLYGHVHVHVFIMHLVHVHVESSDIHHNARCPSKVMLRGPSLTSL